MKIKVEKIVKPWYSPREEFDEEFINDLAKSMEASGQWDPILVRRNDRGEYELIAGSQRLEAARRLGWKEIEANILDVDEQEAAMLALETNIVRKTLKEVEEGKAIKEMMERLKLNVKQIAERLRRSESWVYNRLSLAFDTIKEVQNAISRGWISVEQAVITSQLPKDRQASFLNLVIQKQRELDKKLSGSETRKELKRFLNDTIYTIGYEGWDLDDFLKTLKDNKIEVLVDVRESGASMYKPEFSEKVLKRRVQEAGLIYLERRDFGVPYEIREAYIQGGLSHKCFEEWYVWNVTKPKGGKESKLTQLANELKDLGKSVLMCTERYPTPKGEQKHYCHRDILARLILETGVFEKRVDF